MTVALGDVIFDSVDYDRDGDVLYLSVGSIEPAHREESPEGHVLRFDADGALCGVTVIGLSRHIDPEGRIKVTVPHPEELDLEGLDLVPA